MVVQLFANTGDGINEGFGTVKVVKRELPHRLPQPRPSWQGGSCINPKGGSRRCLWSPSRLFVEFGASLHVFAFKGNQFLVVDVGGSCVSDEFHFHNDLREMNTQRPSSVRISKLDLPDEIGRTDVSVFWVGEGLNVQMEFHDAS